MSMLYPKSRAEWLALRHDYISSTESAALYGLSPYMTAFELAVIKKEPEPPADDLGSERMTWGLRLQRAIAEGIAEDYAVKVRAISGYATQDIGKIGASFDFEIVGLKDVAPPEDTVSWEADQTLREMYKAHGPGVLEIKNVDSFVFKSDWHEEEGYLEAPPHIEIQVQHQLACIERKWAAIGVLVGGNRQIVITRQFDFEVGNSLKQKAARFWNGIAAGHMPQVTLPQDSDIIRRLYRYAEAGKVLDLQGAARNEAIAKLAATHAEATRIKGEAEKYAKGTGAALMMAIGDAEKVLLDDMTVNAGTVKATRVEAYERAAYRSLRVYPKKAKEQK